MVAHDLDVLRPRVRPFKADTPLLVDANAVLPHSVSAELLQAVTRRHPQVIEGLGRVEYGRLAQRYPLDGGFQSSRTSSLPYLFGLLVSE